MLINGSAVDSGESNLSVSVVVLAYNRPDEIRRSIGELCLLAQPVTEVIVVDNGSFLGLSGLVEQFSLLKVIVLEENIGIAGRNVGVMAASGDIVITLDDDVFGLTNQGVQDVVSAFRQVDVGAVNFRIVDDKTEELMDWVHKRSDEVYANLCFDTYEISEGAVAFRRQLFIDAGMYPREYFISHEGPDIALRIMNLRMRVIYEPAIVVRHAHSPTARTSWRRYYYDTRNLLWMVIRLYPAGRAARKLLVGWASMFVYSLKDGYLKYWWKAVVDALRESREIARSRDVIGQDAWDRYDEIDAHNPDFWYLVRKRLSRSVIR